MKNLSNLFFAILFGGIFTVSSMAQSLPLSIENNTDCTIMVDYIKARNCNNSTILVDNTTYCIAPNSSINVSTLGSSDYVWELAKLTPIYECRGEACGPTETLQNFQACNNNISSNTVSLSNCGTCVNSPTAHFDATSTISIY